MIVEQRTYTLYPGKAADYLDLYEREGWPIQSDILGRPLGYYVIDIGPLNRVLHMWAYDSYEDRQARRARLLADPDWQAFVPNLRLFIVSQENLILRPARFSPVP